MRMKNPATCQHSSLKPEKTKEGARHLFHRLNRIVILVLGLLALFSAGCSTGKLAQKDARKETSKKAISSTKGDADTGSSSITEAEDSVSKPSEKKSPGTTPTSPPSVTNVTPAESGLKAGYADDNKQFNYFVNFLQKYKGNAAHFPLDISERIRIIVQDKNKKPVANVALTVQANGITLLNARTYADGSFQFFPSEPEFQKIKKFTIKVTQPGFSGEIEADRAGRRNHVIQLKSARKKTEPVPVDIVFVFDTTASMGEEIARLKNTIELIELNIANLSPKPALRFGMVLYKDIGDEYNTRVVPLTNDMQLFREELNQVEAGGGGDIPENLQDALKDTMQLKWNTTGVRLAFIITDAAAHLDYKQNYTYVTAMREARNRGIKFFSIGTGGLDINGEYVLRQIAQYTYGKYIFLTYGEKGESAGGQAGSVSHHTGEQFTADKLESIIIRFTREEISYLSEKPLEKPVEYFSAVKISGEEREKTLAALFDKALLQLTDYSSVKLKEGSSMAVLPIQAQKKGDKSTAEYFGEQVLLAGKKNKTFKVIERKNLQAILKELELTQTGIMDENSTNKLGKLTEAELLLIGQLYSKDEYEVFLKLIRVETGEVLAVTKARVDRKLGLGK